MAQLPPGSRTPQQPKLVKTTAIQDILESPRRQNPYSPALVADESDMFTGKTL
jgi:hypothetical protein